MVLPSHWQVNDSITNDLPKPSTPKFPLKSYVALGLLMNVSNGIYSYHPKYTTWTAQRGQ